MRFVIAGGRVVDGTGAPAKESDVYIRDGLITDVRPSSDDQVRRQDRDGHGSLGAGKCLQRSAALDHHAGCRPCEGQTGRAAARAPLRQLC